jgi:hypothetical protein
MGEVMMGTEHEEITGGCLCGAVRYEASEPPTKNAICHCHMCQQWTGSAFLATAGFSGAALRFTQGEPKIYRSSSFMERAHCAECGSALFTRFTEPGLFEGVVFVAVGTLDHPEDVTFHFHFGVESQLPWVHFDDDLPRLRTDEDPKVAARLAEQLPG